MVSDAGALHEQVPPAEPQPELGVMGKTPAIMLDGAVGEALKAIAQDLESGDKRWGEDAELDAGQQLLLRWPEAFSGYGLTAKGILDELTRREWLWIDPMAPLKKVLDTEIGGRPVKAIRLEHAISQVLIREPGAIAKAEGSQGRAPSESTLSQDGGPERMTDGPLLGHGPDGGDPKPELRQMKAPERAGRSSKAGEPADGSQTGKNDASRSHRPPGADPAPTRSESRKGPSETYAQPSLDEILEVLSRLPATAQADGWCTLPKSDVMTACRKCGVRVTHGRLGKLAQEEPGRFAVEGIIVKYRP